MRRKNKAIVLIILILLLVFSASSFLYMSLKFGRGVVEGQKTDKERQRDYMKNLKIKKKISDVTNETIEIQLDSISSSKTIFPREYIPPYRIIKNDSICKFIIDKKIIKDGSVTKGQIFKKELNKDYINIEGNNYPLFDESTGIR